MPKEEEELSIDLKGVVKKITENKKLIVYAVLVVILLLATGLRMMPAKYPRLAAMDPYWHYRHASEILENGYPGNGLKEVNGEMVKWDYFHNAPEGAPAPVYQLFPYIIAYSYKYLGQFVTPDLMTWDKYMPVIFGVLAVFFMFMLVKQLFGEKAGLSAAFMFSLSQQFMTRSIARFSDTDAAVAFFTLLTLFLLVRAWDRESYFYAIIGGLSLAGFGFLWDGYTYVPLLIVISLVSYFILKVVTDGLMAKKGLVAVVKKDWKKYATVIILLAVGLGLLAIIVGPSQAAFWKAITAVTQRKATSNIITEEGVIRNVLKTVAEMNAPGSIRGMLSYVHTATLVWVVAFVALLPLGLWKRMKGKIFHLVLIGFWFASTFYSSTTAVRFIQLFAIPLCVVVGISMSYLFSKASMKKPMHSIAIALFVVFTIFFLPNMPLGLSSSAGPSYFSTAYGIAASSGSYGDPTWLAFYNWTRDETPKGSIMASWWDPGHAVTALGERPAVADGAQNHYHVHDLALIFTTNNETEALRLLKKYNVSYFFTSSDLITKFGAISFLASGQADGYPVIGLSDYKQLDTGLVLIYDLGNNMKIIINDQDNTLTATLKQGYQTSRIRRIFYYVNGTGMIAEYTGNETEVLNATIYMPDPKQIIYMAPHIEGNMLTQLHFFNGDNLEHFELVKNFGDQIKVYKVKY